MNKARGRYVPVILVILLSACGSDVPEESGEAAVRPVKLLTLEEAGSGQSRRYPAVVQAASSSELTFQVSGLLQELPVSEAQRVERGALLARLDPRDLQSRMDA